jgi:hypothetical protein
MSEPTPEPAVAGEQDGTQCVVVWQLSRCLTVPQLAEFDKSVSSLASHQMLVRVKGLEPPLPYGKQIFSLPRLPLNY